MNILRFCLIVCLATFALNGVAGADEPMTAAAVKEAMTGNTAVAPRRSGDGFYYLFRGADGYQAMESDNGFSNEGKWHVTEDGQVCSVWEKMCGGEERCVTYYSLGDDRYKFVRPDCSGGEFKVVKGNPKDL